MERTRTVRPPPSATAKPPITSEVSIAIAVTVTRTRSSRSRLQTATANKSLATLPRVLATANTRLESEEPADVSVHQSMIVHSNLFGKNKFHEVY